MMQMSFTSPILGFYYYWARRVTKTKKQHSKLYKTKSKSRERTKERQRERKKKNGKRGLRELRG